MLDDINQRLLFLTCQQNSDLNKITYKPDTSDTYYDNSSTDSNFSKSIAVDRILKIIKPRLSVPNLLPSTQR
ncbi:hypothetical protein I4U23_016274 [Adineta vaga]|nr:hypothetical protein I4U23_016274 [Adineta vaga]